jgi:WD40 repeat protein
VFGAEAIIDDLEDERDTKEDIAEYVRRRLATSPKHHNRPNAIAVAAGRVADQADGVFLYARIVSRTLQESDRLDSALPGTALEAFAHDLRARFGADEQRVDDLLAALAWGEGKGLTRRVWPRIANELARRKRVYDDDDVTWALDHAGWHIIEAGEGGQAVYRLGHQALADNYRGRSEAAKAQDRIVSALTKNIVGAAWLDTDHYLWRHLADHAAQAGRLDILIQDPGYLAVADPARLTAMLPNIRDSRGRAFANIYIRVADRLINQPPLERLSLIHLTAQMDAPNLAVVLDPPTFVRWRASWAKVRPDTPHRTIGRHDAAVSCVSIITADQRPMLISSDDEGSVRFWDARTGEEAGKTLKVSSEGIRSFVAATLEDSDVLFVESDDGALRLWDTQVGKLIASPIERAAGVLSVTSTLNFDHLFFLQTEGSAILCADPATRKAAWKVLSHEVESISSVAFDASENELIELNIADFVRVEAGVADDSKMTIGPHAFLLTDEATRPAWLTDEPRRPAYIFVGNEDGTITVHAADRLGTEPMKSGRITVVNAKAEQMVATIVRDKSSDDWNVYSWNRVATNIFRGHRSRITAIFIARINRRRLVFSGDEDGSILMWDALSRALVGEFPKPTVVAGISLLRLAELDGATILISGRMNGTVQFWEVQQQRELKTLSPFHASPIVTAEIGEMSGRTLFVAGNLEGQIRLWDLKTNTLFGEGPIWRSTILGQLALGKLGHRSIIATRSSRDDDFKVLDMLTGQHICSIVKSRGIATKRIQAEHNGVALEAVARADATIVLVDKRRNRLIGHPLIGHSAPISSLACGLIDDHLVLASGGTDQTIRIWYIYNELEAYRSRHAFTYRIAQYRRFLLDRWRSRRLHAGAVNSVALMQSSGGWIAVSGGNDRSIRAWNVTSGRNIKTLRNYHYAPVTSVSICSIDTKPLIATAGEDGRVLIWDETFRDVLKYIPKLWSGIKLERIKTVIVCEIGNIPTVVSCGQIWSGTFDQGTIGLWDVRTAYQRGFLPRKLFDTSTVAVGSMGNDQVVIAAGEDGIIRLWDCRTGELVGKPLNGHAGPVNSLDFGFADNQRIVASGGRDRTVRIWNLEADEPVSVPIAAHNGAVKSVSLDRAGKVKIVVSGGEDKTIRITSIRSQKELLKIELGSEVFCVAFNSDVGILAGISTGVVLLKIENMLSEL